jgi:ribosomal protein S18 acetylase RimI-like enzyme
VYLSPDFDAASEAYRIQVLSRSSCLLYGSIGDESGPLAAGTASFSQGWTSLHGLRTLESVRGKGLARTLIAAFGREAIAMGFDRCFLQVEETNAPAIRLYRQLGFQTAWRYHYWR